MMDGYNNWVMVMGMENGYWFVIRFYHSCNNYSDGWKKYK